MGTSIKTTVNVFNSFFAGLFILGGYVQAQPFAGGTGEAGDPYRIAAAEQLIAIGSDPNLLDKHFMLVADIDLDPNLPNGRVFNGALIAPDILDANGFDAPGIPFTGSFDGGNHVIRNLVISAPTRYAVGLFGRIGIRDVGKWGIPGVVQNVRLEGVTIDGHESVGALAGANECTIINCSVHGFVTGERDFIGGLVGNNAGTIAMCSTEGNVFGHDYVGGLVGISSKGAITHCSSASSVGGSENIGGLVGESSGSIHACTASGNVDGGEWTGGLIGRNTGGVYDCTASGNVSGSDDTGGFVGSNTGTIVDSLATGMVLTDGHGDEDVGGFAGRNGYGGTIMQCAASGHVTSMEDVGGLVGYNSGTIKACYASGNVTSGDEDAGGLVAINSGAIVQCYARGDVTSHEYTGGLVGSNYGSITECYAVGRVRVTGGDCVGGLVGCGYEPVGSFWDVDTTGFLRSRGGTGLKTADLQKSQTYVDAGWDFEDTWMICEGTDYPRLQWEQHSCEDEQ